MAFGEWYLQASLQGSGEQAVCIYEIFHALFVGFRCRRRLLRMRRRFRLVFGLDVAILSRLLVFGLQLSLSKAHEVHDS
jgi:hypothetical protein